MPEFKLINVAETPYFYVTKTCSMNPEDISSAMGNAFQDVWAHMQAKGVQPAGGAMSVYHTYSPDTLTFRAGFAVARPDLSAAEGEVEADVTPAGEVLHFVHKGSYATLRDDYGLMMKHVTDLGREISAPTWEVYINDPGQVPEADLLTEIYAVLK
jgi:effector-binding domain-containing protein